MGAKMMITDQQELTASNGYYRPSSAVTRHPIELLLQGQERIRIAAGTMAVLADDLWRRGRECYAHAVLTFFEEEWPLRAEDEEYSLMPRLLAGQGATEAVCRMLTTLVHNHDQVRETAAEIGDGLDALTRGALPELPAVFAVNLIRGSELLRRHAEWEEQTFFPWARSRLAPPETAAVWREMTERRGRGEPR